MTVARFGTAAGGPVVHADDGRRSGAVEHRPLIGRTRTELEMSAKPHGR